MKSYIKLRACGVGMLLDLANVLDLRQLHSAMTAWHSRRDGYLGLLWEYHSIFLIVTVLGVLEVLLSLEQFLGVHQVRDFHLVANLEAILEISFRGISRQPLLLDSLQFSLVKYAYWSQIRVWFVLETLGLLIFYLLFAPSKLLYDLIVFLGCLHLLLGVKRVALLVH